MAGNSKHRKGHKEKVAARNRAKAQEKRHQEHRLRLMIEKMVKEQKEKSENVITEEDVTVTEVTTENE